MRHCEFPTHCPQPVGSFSSSGWSPHHPSHPTAERAQKHSSNTKAKGELSGKLCQINHSNPCVLSLNTDGRFLQGVLGSCAFFGGKMEWGSCGISAFGVTLAASGLVELGFSGVCGVPAVADRGSGPTLSLRHGTGSPMAVE